MAHDLVHDAFILAFVSLDKLRDNEKLGEWLATIVRNVALKHIAQKKKMRMESLSSIGANESVASDSSSTLDAYINSKDILMLVSQLPKGYAKVFRLSVIEGFTHKEIAEILGVEPHSSSSQLSRAKKQLRQMIQKWAVAILLFILVPLYFILFRHNEQKVHEVKITKVKKEKKRSQPRPNDVDIPQLPYSHSTDVGTISSEHKAAVISMPIQDLTDINEEEQQTMEIFADCTYIAFNDTVSYPAIEDYHLANNDKTKSPNWKLLATGSLAPALAQNVYKMFTADNIIDSPDTDGGTMKKEHHDKPITFGLSLAMPLCDRWSIETGLQYSLLNSRFTQESGSYATVSNQKVYYLGLPLKLSYRMINYKRLSAYHSVGVTFHLPVHGNVTDSYMYHGQMIYSNSRHISPVPQWATNISLGLQYEFIPNINIFVEPTVNWFIPSGSDTHTIWTEQPLMLTSPFGIRITW